MSKPARKLRGRPARAARTRRLQARLEATRLVARMSGRHIYAQIVAPDARILCAASTLEKEMRQKLDGKSSDTAAAREIGLRVAQKAAAAGIAKVAFDRGGRKYHGRVKALADAAREGGLQF